MATCYLLVIQTLILLPLLVQGLTLEEYLKLVNMIKDECRLDTKNYLPDSDPRLRCPVKTQYSWRCWPEIYANTTITVPCPWIFFKEGSMSRRCNENGTWEKIYNVSCVRVSPDELARRRAHTLMQFEIKTKLELEEEEARRDRVEYRTRLLKTLRYVDAAVTFVCVVILMGLPDFKNIRLNLHRNLMIAFFLGDLIQITLLHSMTNIDQCNAIFVFAMYFFLVQVCCMFNEGLNRTITIYKTFVERTSAVPYTIFAWGFPAIVVFGIYVPVMKTFPPPLGPLKLCWAHFQIYRINYIVYSVAYFFLSVNVLFILYILFVVMTEIRSERGSTECAVAMRGFRGFALLFFLLGGGYLITLYGPPTEWYEWLRVTVQPTQGILVCIFNVLLSKDVWRGFKKRRRQLKSSASMQYLSQSFSKSSKRSDFGSSNLNLNNWNSNLNLNNWNSDKRRSTTTTDIYPEVEQIHATLRKSGYLSSARGSQASIEEDSKSVTQSIGSEGENRRGSMATLIGAEISRRDSNFVSETIKECEEEKDEAGHEVICVDATNKNEEQKMEAEE